MGHVALGQQMVLRARRRRLPARAPAGAGALRPRPPRARRPARAPLPLARGAGAGPAERAGRPGQGRARARPAVKVTPRRSATTSSAVTALLEELGRAAVTAGHARRRAARCSSAQLEDARTPRPWWPRTRRHGDRLLLAALPPPAEPPDAGRLDPRPDRHRPARRRGCRPGAARGGRAARARARLLAADARVRLPAPGGARGCTRRSGWRTRATTSASRWRNWYNQLTSAAVARTQPLPDAVYSALSAQILRGELRPGDALPSERLLAEEFAVNRHAIREAMKRLQQAGLVRVSHGGATPCAGLARHRRTRPADPAGRARRRPGPRAGALRAGDAPVHRHRCSAPLRGPRARRR